MVLRQLLAALICALIEDFIICKVKGAGVILSLQVMFDAVFSSSIWH